MPSIGETVQQLFPGRTVTVKFDGLKVSSPDLSSDELQQLLNALKKLNVLDNIDVSKLRNLTLTQIDSAINNIATLSDAQAVLLKLAHVVYWLLHNELND